MKISVIFRSVVALLVAAGVLSGCDVETFDDAVARIPESPLPPPPSPPPPPPPGLGPTFSEIQASVFTPDCATAGCHSGANPPGGLNLEEANSYAMLVGIQSSQDAGFQRVEAGDPNNSYLIQKLEGTAPVGTEMPPGAPLPQAEIDVIRQWITDGAIDDRVAVLDPITVTSLSPAPNAALTAPPANIIAGFSRDLDQTTANANTILLTASGGDGTFADGNEVPITAASITIGANPQSAVFDLTGMQMNDDTYRISLLGNGASVIMDLDANALDGEFLGALPSGDGIAGGDFMVDFTLMTPVVVGPTLAEIQALVFTPTCATASCHTGPAGNMLPSGLDLSSAANSLASLVDVPSIQDPMIMRVAPGLPDDSYLVRKIEGTAPQGQQMPPGAAPPPDQATIDAIRLWITNGAQP